MRSCDAFIPLMAFCSWILAHQIGKGDPDPLRPEWMKKLIRQDNVHPEWAEELRVSPVGNFDIVRLGCIINPYFWEWRRLHLFLRFHIPVWIFWGSDVTLPVPDATFAPYRISPACYNKMKANFLADQQAKASANTSPNYLPLPHRAANLMPPPPSHSSSSTPTSSHLALGMQTPQSSISSLPITLSSSPQSVSTNITEPPAFPPRMAGSRQRFAETWQAYFARKTTEQAANRITHGTAKAPVTRTRGPAPYDSRKIRCKSVPLGAE